jgi:hypothetical protein
MAVYLSPVGNSGTPFFTSQGVILAGGKINTYQAGSVTPATTYSDAAGVTPNANPIVLNSAGLPATQIWLTGGQAYKFIITDSVGNAIGIPIDNVRGVNDAATSGSEWVTTGISPTFVSATQFTTAGNTTTTYQVGRRIRATVTAGTVYGSITASSFSSTTSVTVSLDSGVLDSGLSVVDVGLISATNDSVPSKLSHGLQVSTLTATGAAALQSTLNVTGASALASTLGVTGDTTLSGALFSASVSFAGSRTLVLSDAGKMLIQTSAIVGAKALTIPPNSSVAFPIGTVIGASLGSSAAQGITATRGSGVSLIGTGGTDADRSIGSGPVILAKVDTDTWRINIA